MFILIAAERSEAAHYSWRVMVSPVNSMSFIWNVNMREKREANANATWRALIRDRPRGDGV
jgi:hypothetical protein